LLAALDTAHVQAGDLDEACRLGGDALGSAVGLDRQPDLHDGLGLLDHARPAAQPEPVRPAPGLARSPRRRLSLTAMFTAYVVVTLLAIAANAFSGVAALVHFRPILPGMARAGVPESWLAFPIGTLKTAGALGLLLGLLGVPLIGTAAAIGLILFFVCALYTHLRAGDYSAQFGLAIGFLLLAVAALGVDLATAGVSVQGQLR
jgi:hypothetical protein